MKVYAVLFTVDLIGGRPVPIVDVIEAMDADEAINTAHNMFILGGAENAAKVGNAVFLPGTVSGITAEVVGVLDMQDEENRKWDACLKLFREFKTNLEKALEDTE